MINEHVFEEPLKDAELEKMFTDNDVFNIAFLEYLYKYIVDKTNNPIKMRFKLPQGTEC